ncbi:MAG: DUF2812 domain-containing protein, partial [Lachnospiraceae bacterium]|nr:DUF2812 domain-containing protein [Lachnospiraceae bacterium]
MEEGKMLERVNAFRIKEKDKTKKRKIRIKSAMGTLEKLGDLEKYFEYMASTGWMIEKIYAGSVLVFAECEPKRIRFMIKKFAESGLTKNSAIEKNIDFLEYCINKEWTYVCVTNMIGVFYTTKENLKKVEIDYEYVRNDKSYKEGVMARVVIPFIV